ncbi:MAG: flagellar hook-basal body protein [Oscillospiraceae bacterium]|nr:flagellar hook-basal body protein [Oscillospiraceae bacterium]
MVRGFYNAGSGMVTQEKRLNMISNNLANVTTAGYKKDGVTMSTFGEHIAVRMNAYQRERTDQIGRGVFMQTTDIDYTNYSQGGFEMTGRPMDFAIAGEGFFIVRDYNDVDYFTRDGQFSLDEEGYLVHPGFGRVQGVDGDIIIGTSEFKLGENGEIYIIDWDNDELVYLTQLLIAQPDDYDALHKAPNGMFIPQEYTLGGIGDSSFTTLQGHVERSNVNMAMEMTEMIAAQRSLQSASQILKMYDNMTEQSYSRISRIT